MKSLTGEPLAHAELAGGRLVGDRTWAAYTADGGIASGKTTRRFRRVDGLLRLRARVDGDCAVPLVAFPDGTERPADDPRTSRDLTELVGQALQLRPESTVQHHDESPVHVVTTADLARLGRPVDAARFRANVLVEADWSDEGHELGLGAEVVLALGTGMPRCVMVGHAQPLSDLPADPALLRQLARDGTVVLGRQASVVRGGVVTTGDAASLR